MTTVARTDHITAARVQLAIRMTNKREAAHLLAASHVPVHVAVRVLTTTNRRA